MNQYLLDTNICIYFIKGLFDLKSKFEEVGPENCFISEITLAELKFGVEKSQAQKKNPIIRFLSYEIENESERADSYTCIDQEKV